MTLIYLIDRIYYKIGKLQLIIYLKYRLRMVLNTVTKNQFDIYKILIELSKTNPLFCSELEFQFYLAWKIKELYGKEYQIHLEYPIKDYEGKNKNIDLLLVNCSGGFIPIELKYCTSKFEQNFGNFSYKLKEHSANDQTRYKYLKDIYRLETFKAIESKFIVGYAIIITNQCRTWQKIVNKSQTDYDFSLEDNSLISSGIKKWSENTAPSTQKDCPQIVLQIDYFIKWQDYSTFNDRHGQFKVLVTEVK